MITRLASLALIAILTLAAACGDDDEVTADASPDFDAVAYDATPADPTLDDICNATDGVYIDFFSTAFDCQAGLLELLFGATTPTDAELSALCEGSLQPYIDDGTVELGDWEAFAACKAYVDSLDCEGFSFDAPNPCDDLLDGTITLGNNCDSDDQCIGPAYCAGGGGATLRGGGAVTCGTCTALIANGNACGDNNECLSGYCKEIDGAPNECAPIADIGDVCESSQDCLGTTVCDGGTNKCASEPASWAVDDACTTFIFDCGGPGSTLYCHPGSLVCKQWLALDATCDPSQGAADLCNLFEYESCQGATGSEVCTAPAVAASPGDACGFFSGIDCAAGMRCDLDSETCATEVALDGDCSGANTACAFLHECVDGTCQIGPYTGMCPAP